MDRLIQRLNSIGKRIFVKYYKQFKYLNKEECIKYLISEKVSNDSGASIRCSNAKAIFKDNMQIEALKIIKNSKKMEEDIVLKAEEIIKIEKENNNNLKSKNSF